MKRSLFVIIVIAVISISAQAKYSGGSGTSGNPYQIANATDLLAMGADANDYGKNFVLTADIDLSGAGTFIAAIIAPDMDNSTSAFDGPKFTGSFNGQWHKISNLHISGDGFYYIGLFGNADYPAWIYDLRLEGASVHGSRYVGGLVGYNSNAHIEGCSTSGNVVGGYESAFLGGLTGANSGSISKCFSTATVLGSDESSYLGGLVGANTDTAVFLNNYATGSVTSGKKSSYLGGLVGYNYSDIFSDGYSTGAVTADINSQFLGGLVGSSYYGLDDSHDYFLNTSGPDNGYGDPLTDNKMKKQSSFVNWHFDTTWQILSGDYPTLQWQSYIPPTPAVDVAKCTVAAGLGSKGDSISFSGTMNTATDDIDSASFIEVQISPEDTNYSSVITFQVNGTTWKKGKFSYSGTENGIKKSFSYAVATGKFAFAASNIDLSGLECPLTIDINVDEFAGTAEVDEAIVNGTKPMPINLLMDVKNSLQVDKSKFTRNKTTHNITQVAVSGGFSVGSVDDANLVTNPLDVNVGSQKFTIPAHNFKYAKGKYTCSKVALSSGEIAAATFDFNKCTFTLTIKNTNFAAAAATTNFDLDFASFSGSDEVTLP